MNDPTRADDGDRRDQDPFPHRLLEPMTAMDRSWLLSLDEALPLLRLPQDLPGLAAEVHDLRAMWLSQEVPDRFDAEPLIRIAGRLLGQHLVDHCHLGWAMVRDSGHRKPAIVDFRLRVLLLPMDAVARYWYQGQRGTIEDLAADLVVLTRAV